MNIFKVLKSFDIFNSEALRFLKDKAINIFLIETNNLKQKGITLSSDNKNINVNIINKPNAYKLLVSAQKRLQEKRANEVSRL